MMNSKGKTDLAELIQAMKPVLNEGEYVFTTIPSTAAIPREITLGEFKEKEGMTVILSKQDAERLQLPFDYVAAWITLSVHSSLSAVGLTAAFSTELARHGISCNVIAGYFHDHIFVVREDGLRALRVLENMKERKPEGN